MNKQLPHTTDDCPMMKGRPCHLCDPNGECEEKTPLAAHTPGPWRFARSTGQVKTIGAHGNVLVARVVNPAGKPEDETYFERSANARRIVACVNACEGTPTETLEAMTEGVVRTVLGWGIWLAAEELVFRNLDEAAADILESAGFDREECLANRERTGAFQEMMMEFIDKHFPSKS